MKISEFNQMMAYVLRPEPKMQVADLVDDLEPGSLKDELLKDFDPSQETYEEYLQRKNLERPFNMAEGGRINFADNPLQNFNIFTDLPFDLNKPLGRTYEVGDKSILKNLQSFDDINPNLRKNYISETELAKILDAPGSTFQDQKYKNVGAYNKLLNVLGEPVVGEKIPGTVKNELYYDKTNLTKDTIEFIKNPKSRIDYGYIGKRGQLVIDDANLKNLFIEKYNEGYGPKHILKVIDPENKLNVNQSKYGSQVAEELIKSNDLIPRTGISKAQKEYHDQKVKNKDLIL